MPMARNSVALLALLLLPCAWGFLVAPAPALSLRAGRSSPALALRMSGDGKGELSAAEKKRQVLREATAKFDAAQEKKRKILEEATRAQQAAEEAAQRAADLKGRGKGFFSDMSASSSSEGSKEASMSDDEDSDSGPVGLPKRKFSRAFFNVSFTKPMGMILEDNDPSVGGVYVAQFTPNSPAEQCEELKLGAQLVSVAGRSVKGLHFEGVMSALKEAESPVELEFFDGSASSLYGGWAEKARGKEVTIDTNRPNKKLIDRIRSGL